MNDEHMQLWAYDERLVPGTIVFSAGRMMYLVIATDDDLLHVARAGDGMIVALTFERKYYVDGPLFMRARLVLVPPT